MDFLLSYYGKLADTDFLWGNTLSVWLGVVLCAVNVGAHIFADEPSRVIEWTRPFSEVVCVAGTLMTVMIMTRFPRALPLWVNIFSLAGHIAVGVSAYGAPFNWKGTSVCSAILVAALAAYWVLETLVGGAWPYPLSPVEVASLCALLLGLRAL
jgi:hypothetical protein